MQPMYKNVETIAAFCPNCEVRLIGYHSHFNPWQCNCGNWKAIIDSKGHYEFEIEPFNPPSETKV